MIPNRAAQGREGTELNSYWTSVDTRYMMGALYEKEVPSLKLEQVMAKNKYTVTNRGFLFSASLGLYFSLHFSMQEKKIDFPLREDMVT